MYDTLLSMQKRKPLFWILFIAGITIIAISTFRFPDLDIRFLGIGKHRHFLFHSAIVPLITLRVLKPIRRISFLNVIVTAAAIGFLVGIGVHLFTDVFQTKSVYFPFIGSLIDGTSIDDRLWEGGNSLICFGSAWKAGRQTIHESGSIADSSNSSLIP
jgi:hypothetical protein